MAVEMWRDHRDNSVMLKFIESMSPIDGREFQRMLIEEVVEAVKNFIATDPDTRILINEMTKQVIKEIDLLSIVKEAVQQATKEGMGQ